MSRTSIPGARQRIEVEPRGRADQPRQRPAASRYLRRGISSGLFAGVVGLVSLGRVRRALREGSSEQAVQRAMLAVFWIGTAATQWGLNRSKRQGG